MFRQILFIILQGTVVMGPNCEIPEFLEGPFPITSKNGLLLPASDTITPAPWATNGKYKVGEIICELHNAETGEVLQENPRTLARKQLDRLQGHGLKLFSAFELEGVIVPKESQKPLEKNNIILSILPLSQYEEFLYDFEQEASLSGIGVENIHCEYDPGQIEYSFVPTYGISSSDNTFRFKEGFKEKCLQKGFHGTFMTKPMQMESCNGTHFNFSVWTEAGENAFYDASRPDNLSETCLYFIAGILHHLDAMCALCAPTVNCYRRFHNAVVPATADWGIDDRFVTLRVKNNGKDGTYIECRLPSGSSNPYLVTASVLAAGLNGMEKKMTAPPKGRNKDAKSVPDSLAEAITALKNDTDFKNALGATFVDWFVMCKEKYEIARFGGHQMKVIKEKELDLERDEYFYYF